MIRALGLPGGGKCSAPQSTAILRLPTPRKPPKSMMAARTCPVRSTMHVDDSAHILVGGAAHLTAEDAFDLMLVENGDFGGGRRRGCLFRLVGDGAVAGEHRRDSDAQREKRGCRHRCPLIPAHAASSDVSEAPHPTSQGTGAGSMRRDPAAAREPRRHAVPGTLGRASRDRRRKLESRRVIRGVSSDKVPLCRRTLKSTVDAPSCRLRSMTSSRNGGRRGLRSRISPSTGSNSRPSEASSRVKGVALAQACGEQATG